MPGSLLSKFRMGPVSLQLLCGFKVVICLLSRSILSLVRVSRARPMRPCWVV